MMLINYVRTEFYSFNSYAIVIICMSILLMCRTLSWHLRNKSWLLIITVLNRFY